MNGALQITALDPWVIMQIEGRDKGAAFSALPF